MTSHPLLRNVDVLHEISTLIGQPILEEHEEPRYDSEGQINRRDAWNARRALFAVLMTCRTFMPVAASVLWRSLPNLDPLLKVLGFDPDDTDVEESILDWTRFEWYARRVKSLHFRKQDADLPSFILNNTPLLPTLHTLYWCHPERLDLAARFTLPSLRRFELSMCPSQEAPWLQELHSYMDSLIASSVPLQRLSFNGCDARLSTQFKALRHLTHLNLPYESLSSEVWRGLDMIPNLERLEIDYMDEDSEVRETQVIALSSTTGLRSLKLLDVTGHWENMHPVVCAFPSIEITHVKFFFPWHPDNEPDYLSEWRDIARILSTKGTLSFELVHVETIGGPPHPLGVATIEPLFVFKALEYLYLTYHQPGDSTITDDDIRRLASALPRLIHLRVDLGFAPDACLTVKSLISLATTCSRLAFLDIDTKLENDGKSLLPDPKDVPLTSCPVYDIILRLRPAPPPDLSARHQKVNTLANILNRLFPKLEYARVVEDRRRSIMQGDHEEQEVTQGGWKQEEIDRLMFPDFY